MNQHRRILVHCTGCGETWEAPQTLLGALCGQGQVRPATESEAYAYLDSPTGYWTFQPEE